MSDVNPRPYCAEIEPYLVQKYGTRRLGGPRRVCMRHRGHPGPHGQWKLVTQVEHATINQGRGPQK